MTTAMLMQAIVVVRLALAVGCGGVDGAVTGISQRSVEHVDAELGNGHHVEQKHDRSQHQSERDIALAPALRLLRRQHDAIVLSSRHHQKSPLKAPMRRRCSTSNAAKSANR